MECQGCLYSGHIGRFINTNHWSTKSEICLNHHDTFLPQPRNYGDTLFLIYELKKCREEK